MIWCYGGLICLIFLVRLSVIFYSFLVEDKFGYVVEVYYLCILKMKRLRVPCSLDLEVLLNEVPAEFKGFKKDKVYWLCNAIYMGSVSLDEDTQTHPYKSKKYYVPLHSDILAHYMGREYYSDIRAWMIVAGIIEVDGKYQTDVTSKGYRFTDRYRHDTSVSIAVTDFILATKKRFVPKQEANKLLKMSRTVQGMKKWWKELTIDTEQARNDIEAYFLELTATAKSDKQWERAIQQRNNSHAIVDMFNGDMEEYYFQDRNGRRLHTVLTRLPKYLRKHVRQGGQVLSQTDISNSQPFFTLYLFKGKNWVKTRRNQTNPIWSGLSYVPVGPVVSFNSIMSSVFDETQAGKDIQDDRYLELVTNGRLYDHFVARMDELGGFFLPGMSHEVKRTRIKKLLVAQINGDSREVDGTPKLINFASIGLQPERRKITEGKKEKNKRLYSGKNYLLWKAFNEDFPKVAAIYRRMKLYNNNDLAYILQRIEGTGVLEVACKEIASQLPDAPIFTLHDCVVTTSEYIERVDAILRDSIATYIGVAPKTKIEHWQGVDESPITQLEEAA